jgi:tRNA nucleotidyltransferase/poly(A) polymerase
MTASAVQVSFRFKNASDHARSIALMKFLSGVARSLGAGSHVYVVGGAVRNFLMDPEGSRYPIKDLDVVVDSVALGKDSDWFAEKLARAIPVETNVTTNQYGVAIVTVKGDWDLDGSPMKGEIIEIANARKESYGGSGGKGKGYKPTDVSPATIEEDVYRREFSFNTLLWRMIDLADGPDKAEVIDITGLGRQHLKEKLIQTPLDPDRTFSDDPTRMLRAIKFLVKYDMGISGEVAASIRKNAHKLRDMPWEAVATILVRDILSTPQARGALLEMVSLGLVDVLAEMIREDKPFAAYMGRQLGDGNRDVALLLDLADLGLGSRPVEFLSKDQQIRLRAITTGMDRLDANHFFDEVRKPPVNNELLIAEFNLVGRERQSIWQLAREALLANPDLLGQGARLEAVVRQGLSV